MRNCLSYSLTMLVMWSTAAEAHCYSVWHYKTPQHCARGKVLEHKAVFVLPPHVPKKEKVVEFVLPNVASTWEPISTPPEIEDVVQRKQAIEELKRKMSH